MDARDRDTREDDEAEEIAVPDENLPVDVLESGAAGLAGNEEEVHRPSPEAPGQPSADEQAEQEREGSDQIRAAG
ncbi:hypothetical protein [Rhizomonospora bruguierae]|uniref:hypothetical protein n=1 Tax=Rhizomonospora bruguierae TaxID=1581705 RepID=UPI001BCFCE2F|nr:hypothetical protein [Micromonospora sp. NBRC 107566]